MKYLVLLVSGAVMLGQFVYALYQDLVVEARKRELEEQDRPFPKLTPVLEEDGDEVVLKLEVATGRKPLRIDRLEVTYGVNDWHMDFLQPHKESYDRFTPHGETQCLVKDDPVELPPYSEQTFTCQLKKPELPPSKKSSAPGWKAGRSSGLRIQLFGSEDRSLMVSNEEPEEVDPYS